MYVESTNKGLEACECKLHKCTLRDYSTPLVWEAEPVKTNYELVNCEG
jgi:hypothetical protein